MVLPAPLTWKFNKPETNALCLLACFDQEEVTHCAAGVRWLTHLHQIAVGSVQVRDMQSKVHTGQQRNLIAIARVFFQRFLRIQKNTVSTYLKQQTSYTEIIKGSAGDHFDVVSQVALTCKHMYGRMSKPSKFCTFVPETFVTLNI